MISIIVPVYNAQSYIDQCIRSVLSQSYRDLELILIDDGSTDESLCKCRRWEDDPRVVLLPTENRGVSAARNLGLQSASGDWILFLDSDDYLLDNCLVSLMALVSPGTQLVLGAYSAGEVRDIQHQAVPASELRRMTLDSINHRLLPGFYELKPLSLTACWAKLYRRDVIRENAIRFHEDLRLSEDTLFQLQYLGCIDQVIITNLPVLHYRQNPSSVTKRFNASHLANRFRFFRILKEWDDPDAAIHILSLLFFDICKLERYTAGENRKQLEREIIGYLSDNADLLAITAKRSLSEGRWQNAAYKAAAACFRQKRWRTGFACLRAYSLVTQGEINRITTNE